MTRFCIYCFNTERTFTPAYIRTFYDYNFCTVEHECLYWITNAYQLWWLNNAGTRTRD